MKFTPAARFWLLVTVLWCLCVFGAGCTAAWTSEASNIINLLVPAITSILSILSAFGVGGGLDGNVFQAIQSWANQSTSALQSVAGLIEQYNSAEAGAQPGLLVEIQTALNTIVSNLAAILPEIHITNKDTQDKVTAVIDLVQNELQALVNLVPALKGEVTAHDDLKKLVAAVKSPKEFRSEFNEVAGTFGKQYEI